MAELGTYVGIGLAALALTLVGGTWYSLRPNDIEVPIKKAKSEIEKILTSIQVPPQETSPTAGQGDLYMNGKHVRVENGKLYEVNSNNICTVVER